MTITMDRPADERCDAALRAPGGVSTLGAMLQHFRLLEPVFDAMPDVVFFVKDEEARYAMVNRTLARRCGQKDKQALIGKTAEDVFPRRFGRIYTAQDKAIIEEGNQLIDQLELHLYAGREPGWCMTCKQPLHDDAGKVVGLAGISRDLQAAEGTHPAYSRLAAVVQHIQENFVQPLNMRQLASMANMSIAQLERYFHKVFHLTPRQVLLKTRLDAATALLVTHDKVTDVAALCGYTDHSAFTRQFKATVGITPTEYRSLLHAGAAPDKV
ncbi:AraC family transcriptional regulator [Caballeronia choica]|uniref:AraC family transcriptional regulator n=2 Tax=Caballeronia choica TaxID=326476 RepID=A0A158GBG0_9BURK|nr:AraC family transcriptional regulator [Caballeronia choica]